MVSTTHADLRMRAAVLGVATSIIHASSISSAVCGLSGLQNYRFGKSCSVPFPAKGWFPTTPIETIAANLGLNLHTLVYLDIQEDRYMCIPEAIGIIEEMAEMRGIEPPALYVGIARAGSESPVVAAGSGAKLRETEFGPRSMSSSSRPTSTPWSGSTGDLCGLMTLEDYGALFAQALSRTGIAVPEETLLHRAAEEVLEMAAAHESDGRTFLRSGDLVNALAGFAYGLGWLDCGCRLGLLAPLAAHPPGEVDARIPDTESAHLHEKTHRYQRMLHSALAMVEPGPDEASPLHAGSGTSTLRHASGMSRGQNTSRRATSPAPSPGSVTGMPGSMPVSGQGCCGSPANAASLRSSGLSHPSFHAEGHEVRLPGVTLPFANFPGLLACDCRSVSHADPRSEMADPDHHPTGNSSLVPVALPS